ncbi:MAG: hypothetical protein ACTHK4_04255 [Mycobacteriales bacterium]
MYFKHEKRTKHHFARLIIRIVANGSLITDLKHVHLRHCDWNLGSARAKHYNGGRQKLWIAVTRKHQHTKGSESFYVVDAAGQRTLVTGRV